jgi:hypothetical protein
MGNARHSLGLRWRSWLAQGIQNSLNPKPEIRNPNYFTKCRRLSSSLPHVFATPATAYTLAP